MFELELTVTTAERTQTHDKTDVAHDPSSHFVGFVGVEFNATRTVDLNQQLTIVLAAGRINSELILGDQFNERSYIVGEQCFSDRCKCVK